MYRNIYKQGLLLYIAALVLTVVPAWPQASTGTVSGTVRDQSGGVIPSASVTLTKTDTSEVYKSSTNSAGFYMFPGLVPGPYRLAVESPGMQKYQGNLTLQVQQSAVVDVAMNVGRAMQTVTVEDVTPQVATDNGMVSYLLEHQRIEQLPINGRQILTLLSTIPGMEGTRAFGIEDHSYSFQLDGADIATRNGWNEITQRQPGLDSIQEFRVVENASSARYARPVTIVAETKSGTNQLHGSAFETNRNNGYGYARTRDTYGSAPFLNRNEFGANGGGPVYIPKLYNGKNKTFWFFSYEALRQVNPQIQGFPTPTEAWRNGDMSNDIDTNGIPYIIYNPYTTDPNTWERQPFPNNQIPASLEGPLAKKLLSVQPLPTLPDVNPNIAPNWYGSTVNWQRNYTISARIDEKIGDKDTFYGRYTRGGLSTLSQFYSQPTLNYNVSPGGTQGYISPDKSIALSWTHTISPSFFNQLTMSGAFIHMYVGTGAPVNYDAELGLPNPFGAKGWAAEYYAGLENVGSGLEWESQNTNAFREFHGIINDDATKVRGTHQFQFGFHFRNDQLHILPAQQYAAGEVEYSSKASMLYDPSTGTDSPDALPFTGDDFANFFMGVANYANQLTPGMFYGQQNEYSAYVQDNWKLSSRLTVNVGLRYDYWSPFTEKHNVVVGFDPNYNSGQSCGGLLCQGALVTAAPIARMEQLGYTFPSIVAREQALGVAFETPQQAGIPSNLQTSNKHDFAPRVSLAYQLTHGARPLVLRGGYALSYFHIALNPWAQRMRQNAPMSVKFFNSLTQAQYSPDGIQNFGLRSVPTIIAGQNSSNAVSTTNADSIVPSTPYVDYFALNQPDARVHTWNFTLEKELPWKVVASLAYVGNHSFGNELLYNYNNSTPAYEWAVTTGTRPPSGTYSGVATRNFNQHNFSTIEEWLNTGWGNSNGAEFQVKRTFGGGSVFQFFYTLDNNFAAGGLGYSGIIPAPNQFLPSMNVPTLSTIPTSLTSALRTLEQNYWYQRDTTIPKHRYSWNWLEDIPVGRGKRFLSNANSLLNKFVGGWQIAGIGTARSTYWALPTSDFPTGTPIQIYGYKYPIQNCTSGECFPGYLYWNGYIPSNLINTPNGYQGIPADYKPAVQPLIPYGATSAPNMPAGTNIARYYNTNTVWVPLNNGSVYRTSWSGINGDWHQYLPGTRQWSLDASLIKNIAISEGRVNLRLECDFFNVLNHPDNPTSPGSSGILSTQTQNNSPRTLQLVGRITF